jgi:methyl-accepting chemotaxis protein
MNIIDPAIRLMNLFNYKQKFTILSGVVFIVFAILTYQVTSAALTSKNFSQTEIQGGDYLKPAMSLMTALQNYRYLFSISNANDDDIAANKMLIEKIMKELDAKDFEYGAIFNNSAQLLAIKTHWNKIIASTHASIDDYTALIAETQQLISNTCDASNLTLDPDIDTYYLMDTYCIKLPALREEISLMQILGNIALKNNALTENDKENLIIQSAVMNTASLPGVQGNIKKVTDYNPSKASVFNKSTQTLSNLVNNFYSAIKTELLPAQITLKQDLWTQQTQEILASIDKLIPQTGNELINLINIRVDGIVFGLIIILIITCIGQVTLFYFLTGLYLSINENVNLLSQASTDLAHGKISGRIVLTTQDELQNVAQSFNLMNTTLTGLITDISNAVNSTTDGDLTKRINIENSEGFIKELSTAINSMQQSFQTVIDNLLQIFSIISEGNLKEHEYSSYRGVFGALIQNINKTCSKLQTTIMEIQNASQTVKDSAKFIANSNDDVSNTIIKQGNILEDITVRTQTLTQKVQQNFDYAKEANGLAQSSSDIAKRGSDMMNNVVSTMNTINDSAKKIFAIINVIDEITFQTNLLALNAAVEAARAGEQGQGFAVVANEVRNLARRSATAAKEINVLISSSVEQITQGSKVVDETGKTIREILTSIEQVTTIMSKITNASFEQSQSIEAVNQAIKQMKNMLDENQKFVQNTTVSTDDLRKIADNMNNLVHFFKLDNGNI